MPNRPRLVLRRVVRAREQVHPLFFIFPSVLLAHTKRRAGASSPSHPAPAVAHMPRPQLAHWIPFHRLIASVELGRSPVTRSACSAAHPTL